MTTLIDQTTDLNRPRVELEPDATTADLATLELESSKDGLDLESIAITERTGANAPAPVADAPARARARETDPDEAAETVEHDELLDIEDSTRLYLREIARVPLLTAEEEVMLAKTMELGLRIKTDPTSTSGA